MSRLAWPAQTGRCIPLRVTPTASERGPRIGGAPPEGALPPGLTPESRYFATVPFLLGPERQLSIYLGVSVDELIELSGSVQALDLVRVTVHAPSQPDSRVGHESTLLPCGLEMLPETEDDLLDDDGTRVIRPGYKLGGRPHCVHDPIESIEGGRELLSEGFIHAAQFDAFGLDEDVDLEGENPLGDGILHVFVRDPSGRPEWRWLCEF